jgi:hypothetical protein
MKRFAFLLLLAFILCRTDLHAATIFAGYAKTPWGADTRTVSKSFPKGKLSKVGPQDVYKQTEPNSEIRQRSFAFSPKKGLVAVSVTFKPGYVKKTGIENLLAKQKKLYGEGAIDRTGAPHMVTYRWQDAVTRITFAYAPKKPDLTIMIYEKK